MKQSSNGMVFLQLKTFLLALWYYVTHRLFVSFDRFESVKDMLVGGLTAKRGRYVRPFLHTSMTGLFLIGLALTPLISEAIPADTSVEAFGVGGAVLGQSTEALSQALTTQVSVKPRDSVMPYTVQDGDTLSSIAQKFQVATETILWHNNMHEDDPIKIGEVLDIPPITGIVHKVKRGDTIYSIAKKYQVDPQAIVNWPFNSYIDDENFGLAVGQSLTVPDGIMPETKREVQYVASRTTPNAGAVSATGSFIWPTSGGITQYYVWYHPAIDIANKAAPEILAADAGTVVVAGWPDNYGYGNRVLIDHGNGFSTLYAHLSAIYVTAGQTVTRGASIGQMGSTGRSTGTHLHFEIHTGGGTMDPLGYLQ